MVIIREKAFRCVLTQMWTHVSILCVNLWNKKLSQFTGLVKAAEELSVVLKRDLKRAVILEVCCCKVLSLALYQVNTNLLCHLTLKKKKRKKLKRLFWQHTWIAVDAKKCPLPSSSAPPCPVHGPCQLAKTAQKRTQNELSSAWWCTS